jgi:hypothetical protein
MIGLKASYGFVSERLANNLTLLPAKSGLNLLLENGGKLVFARSHYLTDASNTDYDLWLVRHARQ